MALSASQVAQVQAKLANEHKLELSKIGRIAENDMRLLFNAIRDADDASWARLIRKLMPEIIAKRGLMAAALSAAYYDDSRKVYALATIASVQVKKPYAASVQLLTESEYPKQILATSMDRTGYFMGQAFKPVKNGIELPVKNIEMPPRIEVPGLTPAEVVEIQMPTGNSETFTISPYRQEQETALSKLAQRSTLNFSTELIQVNMDLDPAAENNSVPRRVSSAGGCPFCKNVIMFAGMKEDQKKFHDGCNCSPQPAWSNEPTLRPDWADEFEAARDKAYQEILEHDRALTRKTREVVVERIDSKGRKVKEKKTRVYYVDAEGKPAEYIPMTDINIINRMRRKQ